MIPVQPKPPVVGKHTDVDGYRVGAVVERGSVVYEVRISRGGAWLMAGHPYATFADAVDHCEVLAQRVPIERPKGHPEMIWEGRPDQRVHNHRFRHPPSSHRLCHAGVLASKIRRAREKRK